MEIPLVAPEGKEFNRVQGLYRCSYVNQLRLPPNNLLSLITDKTTSDVFFYGWRLFGIIPVKLDDTIHLILGTRGLLGDITYFIMVGSIILAHCTAAIQWVVCLGYGISAHRGFHH